MEEVSSAIVEIHFLILSDPAGQQVRMSSLWFSVEKGDRFGRFPEKILLSTTSEVAVCCRAVIGQTPVSYAVA